MKNSYKIIWSFVAKNSLESIYDYIKKESLQNAKQVKRKIVELISDLLTFPEKHPREPFLDKTKGNFRFTIIWSYKIIYEIKQ